MELSSSGQSHFEIALRTCFLIGIETTYRSGAYNACVSGALNFDLSVVGVKGYFKKWRNWPPISKTSVTKNRNQTQALSTSQWTSVRCVCILYFAIEYVICARSACNVILCLMSNSMLIYGRLVIKLQLEIVWSHIKQTAQWERTISTININIFGMHVAIRGFPSENGNDRERVGNFLIFSSLLFWLLDTKSFCVRLFAVVSESSSILHGTCGNLFSLELCSVF